MPKVPMYDIPGCLHFHSQFSFDGRVPVQDILPAAQRAGLAFAVLTDHSHLDARSAGWERYHASADGKKVLLIVGEEISPRYNHYLALGIEKPLIFPKIDLHPQ